MTLEQEAVFLRRLLADIQARLDAIQAVAGVRDSYPGGFRWSGHWSQLPPSLNARHMAAIEGVTIGTIWDRIQKRTMRPAPDRWWRPYRWNRNRVQAEYERV